MKSPSTNRRFSTARDNACARAITSRSRSIESTRSARNANRRANSPSPEAKGNEQSHRHEVRRAGHPVGQRERQAERVEQQPRIHRMTDVAVDALGDEAVSV